MNIYIQSMYNYNMNYYNQHTGTCNDAKIKHGLLKKRKIDLLLIYKVTQSQMCCKNYEQNIEGHI